MHRWRCTSYCLQKQRRLCCWVRRGHRNTVPLFSSRLCVCVSVCVCAHDEEARNVIYYLHHSLLTRLKCVCFFANKSSPREWVGTGSVFLLPLCGQVLLVHIYPIDRRAQKTFWYTAAFSFFPFPGILLNGVVYGKYIQQASCDEKIKARIDSNRILRMWRPPWKPRVFDKWATSKAVTVSNVSLHLRLSCAESSGLSNTIRLFSLSEWKMTLRPVCCVPAWLVWVILRVRCSCQHTV